MSPINLPMIRRKPLPSSSEVRAIQTSPVDHPTVRRKPLPSSSQVRAFQPHTYTSGVRYSVELGLRKTIRISPPQSASSRASSHHHRSHRRLTKAPKVHTPRRRPSGNRLRKGKKTLSQATPHLIYILQYEHYPYNSQPACVLGIYSNIDRAVAGTANHGAFPSAKDGTSKESVFLTATGRIRIIPVQFERTGVDTRLPPSPPPPSTRPRDPPASRPQGTRTARQPKASDNVVLIAIHQSPTGPLLCIGAFTQTRRAWQACLRHQTTSVHADLSREETKWVDEEGLPHLKAKITGTGWQEWFVAAHYIDEIIGREV